MTVVPWYSHGLPLQKIGEGFRSNLQVVHKAASSQCTGHQLTVKIREEAGGVGGRDSQFVVAQDHVSELVEDELLLMQYGVRDGVKD